MHVSTRRLQTDYDEASDSFYLYSEKEKVKGSIELGNIIIDYGLDGTVVGLEFLKATETITPLLVVSPKTIYKDDLHLKEEFMNQIDKASISLHTAANFLIIEITLQAKEQQVQGKLGIPVSSSQDLAKAHILAT